MHRHTHTVVATSDQDIATLERRLHMMHFSKAHILCRTVPLDCTESGPQQSGRITLNKASDKQESQCIAKVG